MWVLNRALATRGYRLIFCVFHALTGLYCPGCGAGRALSALLRLAPREAFGYNQLFVVTLPFLVIALARAVYFYIRYGKAPKPHKRDFPAAIAIAAAAVLFTVMRNIPALAFLAPSAGI